MGRFGIWGEVSGLPVGAASTILPRAPPRAERDRACGCTRTRTLAEASPVLVRLHLSFTPAAPPHWLPGPMQNISTVFRNTKVDAVKGEVASRVWKGWTGQKCWRGYKDIPLSIAFEKVYGLREGEEAESAEKAGVIGRRWEDPLRKWKRNWEAMDILWKKGACAHTGKSGRGGKQKALCIGSRAADNRSRSRRRRTNTVTKKMKLYY